MDLKKRILLARKEAGLTQTELAHAVGVTRGAAAQWEAGTVRPRHPMLTKIAEATGKSTAWLEYGVDDNPDGLTVVGEVAAGMWKEGHITFRQHNVPVTPHPSYPAGTQRLYRVSGTSLNRLVEDGDYLHCVSVLDGGAEPVSGDVVIVRRTEHGRVEYSAKRLIWHDDHWVLRPESNDPEFQEPLEIKGNDDTEIVITDIVIAKWCPIPRGSL